MCFSDTNVCTSLKIHDTSFSTIGCHQWTLWPHNITFMFFTLKYLNGLSSTKISMILKSVEVYLQKAHILHHCVLLGVCIYTCRLPYQLQILLDILLMWVHWTHMFLSHKVQCANTIKHTACAPVKRMQKKNYRLTYGRPEQIHMWTHTVSAISI